MILLKGCKVNEELEPLRRDFENVALYQEPEISADWDYTFGRGKLDYTGDLDSIIRRRDQRVEEAGCTGLGYWKVKEYSLERPTVLDNYSVICWPF